MADAANPDGDVEESQHPPRAVTTAPTPNGDVDAQRLPRAMTTPPAPDGDAEGQAYVNIPLTSIGTPSTRPDSPESPERERYERYLQLMLVIASLFVATAISALTINGFNDQPATRILLMVTTIASWFTLASLYLIHVEQPNLARMKRTIIFPSGSLTLSSLAFIAAVVASSFQPEECDPACHTVGVLVERVLVVTLVAGGFIVMYWMHQTLHVHHVPLQAFAHCTALFCSLLDYLARISPLSGAFFGTI